VTLPILHHYNESPYAEKIRTLLGYKGLPWRSVIVPRIAPKPDLVALTGGYRKVPVLQLGADLYCDTRLIAQQIERLAPSPAIDPSVAGWNDVVEHWVDVNLFGKAVGFTLGSIVDYLDDAFLADRAALRGAPLDRAALKASVPQAEQELAAQIAWIERGLASAPFVGGAQPGSADFTLYSTLWFVRNGRFDFSRFPATATWMERLRAFGHGPREDLGADEAIALAREATPAALPAPASDTPDLSGLLLGQAVSITPELLGHGTTVTGTLVRLDAQALAVALDRVRAGRVHVQFPRLGFRVREAVQA
jgi:glutathione S-transferase